MLTNKTNTVNPKKKTEVFTDLRRKHYMVETALDE